MKEQSMEILIGKKIRDLSKKKQDELLKVIKPLTETKSLFFIYEEIINNIEHIMSNLAETFEKVGGLEKYYLERADKIKESGWALSSLLMEEEIIEDDKTMSDEFIYQLYKGNKYENLFNELETVKFHCKKDFEDTLNLIIELLHVDMKYYPICVGTLFSIIDYSFVYQLLEGNMKNDKYFNNKEKEKYLKKIEIDRTVLNKKRREMCFQLVIEKYFRYANFDVNKLTRHSVQHGRYNVTNINEKDFIKIVNICSAFVEFNKPNESISFLTE
ncbi:hypothetical protein C656_12915 [Enterococcus hirae 57-03-H11]|uniref:hypothetical protein n=1 Tax=Enterococcus TaxID=1350 RepID=UPI000B5408FE|nr:hypothetical protein [Enterococcus hirae]OWW63211.1 hypothetical protein C656_12915 [Enterococcus hirae 57-03-H11]EMF0182607.1 hypothetical protein [Enterococcus hirae]EMF0197861.1 hypothetical protein [Enterococcus hirae]MCV3097312.1 hypothetical protein [Enterococcus hirae]MCV3107459.1 hypothetical protein [Enterococcus hirae]